MNRLSRGTILAVITSLIFSHAALAQRQMEKLGRGVVAVRSNSTQIYVGWRLLGNDPQDISFNLYRSANGAAAVKINGEPLTASTNYLDTPGNLSTTSYTYSVKLVIGGAEVPDVWTHPRSGPFTLPANPFEVRRSTAMTGAWELLDTLAPITPGPANFTDTDPPPARGFYRIILLQ